LDLVTRDVILTIESNFKSDLEQTGQRHLPSRTRSLLWIRHAIPVLRELGEEMPDESSVALHIPGAAAKAPTESCAAL
jgi:hypothetical protein